MAWSVILLLLNSAASCPSVSCVSDLPATQCMQSDLDTGDIEVQSCAAGLVCEFNQMINMQAYDFQTQEMYCVQESLLLGKKYPGEQCTAPEECMSNICQSGTCLGDPENSPCSDFANCAPGLICWGGVCKSQVRLGGSCSQSWQCVNNGLCAGGVCTRFYSLPLHQPVTDTSQVCETGYSEQGVCASPPSNENFPDEPCTSSSDCSLSNGESGECWCGFNTEGRAFCMSQPGDTEYTTLKSSLLAVIDSSVFCHFNISMTPRCPRHAQDPAFQAYQTAVYIYYYRPIIIGIPDCMMELMPFALNYTYTYTDVGSLGGSTATNTTTVIVVAVCVFVVLLCLGLVCFLCIRRFVKMDTWEQVVYRRIRDNEFMILEVFEGVVPDPPPAPSDHTCKFTFTDIKLSEKDRRFILAGMPLAIPVHEDSHEVLTAEIAEAPLADPRPTPVRPSAVQANPTSVRLSPVPPP